MKSKRPAILKIAARAGVVLACASIIFVFKTERLLDSDSKTGLRTASATAAYGIYGRQAPELDLSTWIDGDGKQIKPIKLEAFRGKVIYLFFFQEW